jgi:dynein heavy chain
MNMADRSYFYHLMKEICVSYFSTVVIPLPDDQIIDHPPVLIFGDFMTIGIAVENKVYEEIENIEKLRCVLQVLHCIY